MGIGHFLLNQGVLPEGESVVEQLAALNIAPKDLDFVIMTHLHTDHASGLKQLVGAKKFLSASRNSTTCGNFRFVTSAVCGKA